MLRNSIFKFYNIINRTIPLTASRNYAPRRRRTEEESEPGINKRLRFFKEDILSNEDPEVIDSMEPNFMNLADTHRRHESEMRKFREKTQRMIVAKKYFHKKSPNFLTYNEKEQIRALYEEDSEKWSIDKLSESFPADPYVIGLVIRSKWIPKDTNRIFRHDESVKRNWRDFIEGKLEVEPILSQHLKKFTFRDINEIAERPPNKRLGVEFPKPKSNEFSSIITSCSKYNQNDTQVKKIEPSELRVPKQRPKENENSFMMYGKKKFSPKSITLSELQMQNSEINEQVQLNEISSYNENELQNYRHDTTQEHNFISLPKVDEKILESLEITEKIKIPKKFWKKGKIYKVHDCFYADDGEFLYRVPGFRE